MRVLVVSQYFWPEDFRINDIVLELERRGHDVTVLTGKPNYPEGRIMAEFRQDPARFARFGSTPVLRVPLIPRGRGGSLRLVANYVSFAVSATVEGILRLRGTRFDAILAFLPSPITASLPALAVSRSGRTPVILWVLDLWPESLAAVGVIRAPWALGLIGCLVRFIYRRSALVLGQSKGFRGNVEKYSGDPARFRYFPNWPEPLFSTALSGVEPADQVRRFAGRFNIMFAGNVGHAQDFGTILDAAERLKGRCDVHWLVVGDGRAAGWVRSEITRRGLGGAVVMLGRHAMETMPSFFRVATAMLVTLRSDPLFALTVPGKLQAYLAAGLPVVGALDGEGARIIEDSRAGFACVAGDGRALANAVQAMAALTPAERAAMGERGREYCEREFGRERLMGALERWLDECRRRAARP